MASYATRVSPVRPRASCLAPGRLGAPRARSTSPPTHPTRAGRARTDGRRSLYQPARPRLTAHKARAPVMVPSLKTCDRRRATIRVTRNRPCRGRRRGGDKRGGGRRRILSSRWLPVEAPVGCGWWWLCVSFTSAAALATCVSPCVGLCVGPMLVLRLPNESPCVSPTKSPAFFCWLHPLSGHAASA